MKERIIEFLKAENKSSAQLAEEIGVQPSGISHIISGRNKPSLDFVLKMLEKYRFISIEWLLFGTGSMYKEPEIQTLFDDLTGIKEKSGKNELDNGRIVAKKEPAVPKDGLIAVKEVPVVKKIVWFYSDNSFKEYFPEKE